MGVVGVVVVVAVVVVIVVVVVVVVVVGVAVLLLLLLLLLFLLLLLLLLLLLWLFFLHVQTLLESFVSYHSLSDHYHRPSPSCASACFCILSVAGWHWRSAQVFSTRPG